MSLLRVLFAAAAAASFVFAHVVVTPDTSAPGKEQQYTIHVPNEKKINTTAVKVTFPAGVEVISVAERQGWKLEIAKDAQGKIASAAWTGGALPPEETVEFKFTVKNPAQPATLQWKAFQTYQDGTIVEWTGAKGAKTPASQTAIK